LCSRLPGPFTASSNVYNHEAMTISEVEQRIAEVFRARADVAAVYLFGSTARGTAKRGSDVDVAVLFTQPPAHTLDGPRLVIEGELEEVLGCAVDLVSLNDAPVDLRARILRDGRLIVDRDRSARIAFEVRTRNEAFDFEPVLTRYRSGGPHRRS
jgi:predicted nucleotidyltransferase